MRALVVTNMCPPPGARARASCATRSRRCASSTTSRSRSSPSRRRAQLPARRARAARRYRGERFDVIHAHFGLTAWPALPRCAAPARGDAARHRPAPSALAADHARGAAAARPDRRRPRALGARGARRRGAGPSRSCRAAWTWTRFRRSRGEARERLGVAPAEPVPAVPADPARPSSASTARRRSRATRDCSRWGASLPRGPSGSTPPTQCSCPPQHEGFGLAVLEALGVRRPGSPRRSGSTRPRSTGSPARCARPTIARRGGPRSRRTSRPPTRASRAATGPSCGRPGGWRARARRLAELLA